MRIRNLFVSTHNGKEIICQGRGFRVTLMNEAVNGNPVVWIDLVNADYFS